MQNSLYTEDNARNKKPKKFSFNEMLLHKKRGKKDYSKERERKRYID